MILGTAVAVAAEPGCWLPRHGHDSMVRQAVPLYLQLTGKADDTNETATLGAVVRWSRLADERLFVETQLLAAAWRRDGRSVEVLPLGNTILYSLYDAGGQQLNRTELDGVLPATEHNAVWAWLCAALCRTVADLALDELKDRPARAEDWRFGDLPPRKFNSKKVADEVSFGDSGFRRTLTFDDKLLLTLATVPVDQQLLPAPDPQSLWLEDFRGVSNDTPLGKLGWQVMATESQFSVINERLMMVNSRRPYAMEGILHTFPPLTRGAVEFTARIGRQRRRSALIALVQIIEGTQLGAPDTRSLFTCFAGNDEVVSWERSRTWNRGGSAALASVPRNGRRYDWHQYRIVFDTHSDVVDYYVDGALTWRDQEREVALFDNDLHLNGDRAEALAAIKVGEYGFGRARSFFDDFKAYPLTEAEIAALHAAGKRLRASPASPVEVNDHNVADHMEITVAPPRPPEELVAPFVKGQTVEWIRRDPYSRICWWRAGDELSRVDPDVGDVESFSDGVDVAFTTTHTWVATGVGVWINNRQFGNWSLVTPGDDPVARGRPVSALELQSNQLLVTVEMPAGSLTFVYSLTAQKWRKN